MKLKPDQWYVRWFFWNCKVLDNSKIGKVWPEESLGYRLRSAVDICTMMRILTGGSMIFLLNVLAYLSLLSALVIMPMYAFGAISTVIVYLAVILFITIIGLAVAGAELAPGLIKKGYHNAVHSLSERAKSGSGFVAFIANWMSGIKNRMCVLIQFERNEDKKDSSQ